MLKCRALIFWHRRACLGIKSNNKKTCSHSLFIEWKYDCCYYKPLFYHTRVLGAQWKGGVLVQWDSSHPLHWHPSPAASVFYPSRQMLLVVLFCYRWKAVRARAKPALQHSTRGCERVTGTSEAGLFLRYEPCVAPCLPWDLTWCLAWCLPAPVHRGEVGNNAGRPVDPTPSVVGTGQACCFSRSRYRPPATMLLHFNVAIPLHIHANLCLGSGTPVGRQARSNKSQELLMCYCTVCIWYLCSYAGWT